MEVLCGSIRLTFLNSRDPMQKIGNPEVDFRILKPNLIYSALLGSQVKWHPTDSWPAASLLPPLLCLAYRNWLGYICPIVVGWSAPEPPHAGPTYSSPLNVVRPSDAPLLVSVALLPPWPSTPLVKRALCQYSPPGVIPDGQPSPCPKHRVSKQGSMVGNKFM